jgi:hypothetical protein
MIERRVKRQLSKGWRFHTSGFDPNISAADGYLCDAENITK